MRLFFNRSIPLFFLFVILFPFTVQAENKVVQIEIKGDMAKVTLLEGKAELIHNSSFGTKSFRLINSLVPSRGSMIQKYSHAFLSLYAVSFPSSLRIGISFKACDDKCFPMTLWAVSSASVSGVLSFLYET